MKIKTKKTLKYIHAVVEIFISLGIRILIVLGVMGGIDYLGYELNSIGAMFLMIYVIYPLFSQMINYLLEIKRLNRNGDFWG